MMYRNSMKVRRQSFEFWVRDRPPVVAGPPGHTGRTVRVKRTYAPCRPADLSGYSEDHASRHRAVSVRLGTARMVGQTAVYEYDRSTVRVNKTRRGRA